MKYVIIIPDGAADQPLDELAGKTPFEAAHTPHTDALSTVGHVGTVATTPSGWKAGSDVCCMSLLGYNPIRYHSGRAPLEAAALGLELDSRDWIFRVNFVTVLEGLMQDHSAGHITSQEGKILLTDFAQRVDIPGMTLYPGVSYRNIMVDTSGSHLLSTEGSSNDSSEAGRDWSDLSTIPPHEIPGEPIAKHLPTGRHAQILRQMIEQSESAFTAHDLNKTRIDLGDLPATHLWPWGQGRTPNMPTFESRFGMRGAIITAVDLLAGIAHYIGWDRLDVPGQTSYHDTDYAAAGRHAIDALEDYDLVCVHLEAPDEASHAGDSQTKVAAIEAIDQHVVNPIHAALQQQYGHDWRLLYLPDHYTLVSTRKHDATPVPFAICGKNVRSVVQRPFNEETANDSDLHINYGHELMEYFLFGGLP